MRRAIVIVGFVVTGCAGNAPEPGWPLPRPHIDVSLAPGATVCVEPPDGVTYPRLDYDDGVWTLDGVVFGTSLAEDSCIHPR